MWLDYPVTLVGWILCAGVISRRHHRGMQEEEHAIQRSSSLDDPVHGIITV